MRHLLPKRPRLRGFTLVEVLVAVAILSVLTLMAWQAVDALSRTEQLTRSRASDLAALQAGLNQWATDLDHITDTSLLPAFDHNGRTTRLTRRAQPEGLHHSPGVQVVAWTVRDGHWWRWTAPPQFTQAALQTTWEAAAQWGQRTSDADRALQVAVVPAGGWQVYVYRDGTWTNPLSSTSTPPTDGKPATTSPEGVRLVLTPLPPLPVTGDLIRDWANPTRGGGKS
jgi:general secretion pathway protein J